MLREKKNGAQMPSKWGEGLELIPPGFSLFLTSLHKICVILKVFSRGSQTARGTLPSWVCEVPPWGQGVARNVPLEEMWELNLCRQIPFPLSPLAALLLSLHED